MCSVCMCMFHLVVPPSFITLKTELQFNVRVKVKRSPECNLGFFGECTRVEPYNPYCRFSVKVIFNGMLGTPLR